MSAADRARGALYGLAIGDALGMPTQLLSRQQITARWGPLLTGFEPAPPGHPIAAGLPPGAVTDDTEQAVLLARMLVKNRGVPGPDDWAAALIGWELDMAERGSLDLLGPSTKRALTAVLEGTPPEEAGRHGDTNGAAMRITPVGIAFAAGLIDRVVEASLVTHNTSVALAGAAAVAAAVSAGIDGASVAGATDDRRRRRPAGVPSRPLGRRRRRRGPHPLGRRADRRRGARPGRRADRHPGRHQPGHPGVGARRVRRAQRDTR